MLRMLVPAGRVDLAMNPLHVASVQKAQLQPQLFGTMQPGMHVVKAYTELLL